MLYVYIMYSSFNNNIICNIVLKGARMHYVYNADHMTLTNAYHVITNAYHVITCQALGSYELCCAN